MTTSPEAATEGSHQSYLRIFTYGGAASILLADEIFLESNACEDFFEILQEPDCTTV